MFHLVYGHHGHHGHHGGSAIVRTSTRSGACSIDRHRGFGYMQVGDGTWTRARVLVALVLFVRQLLQNPQKSPGTLHMQFHSFPRCSTNRTPPFLGLLLLVKGLFRSSSWLCSTIHPVGCDEALLGLGPGFGLMSSGMPSTQSASGYVIVKFRCL